MAKVDEEGLEKAAEFKVKQKRTQRLENIIGAAIGIGTGIAITAIAIFDYAYQYTKQTYFPVVAMLWAAGCYYLGWRSYQNLK